MMSRPPFTTSIVFVSLIAAIAVWVGSAYRALQPDGGIVASVWWSRNILGAS